jgi:hypothetical protein
MPREIRAITRITGRCIDMPYVCKLYLYVQATQDEFSYLHMHVNIAV